MIHFYLICAIWKELVLVVNSWGQRVWVGSGDDSEPGNLKCDEVMRFIRTYWPWYSHPRLRPPASSGPRWPRCPPRGRPRSWPGAPWCRSQHSTWWRGMLVLRLVTFLISNRCCYVWKNHVDKNRIKFKALSLDHENEVFIILFHLWSSISQLGPEVVTIHVLSRSIFYSYSVSIQMKICVVKNPDHGTDALHLTLSVGFNDINDVRTT